MSRKSERSPSGLRSTEGHSGTKNETKTTQAKEPLKGMGLRHKSAQMREKLSLSGKFSKESVTRATGKQRLFSSSLKRPRSMSGESVKELASVKGSDSGSSIDRPPTLSESSDKVVEILEVKSVEEDTAGVPEIQEEPSSLEVPSVQLYIVEEVAEIEGEPEPAEPTQAVETTKEEPPLCLGPVQVVDSHPTVKIAEHLELVPSCEPERTPPNPTNDFQVLSAGSCVVQMRSSLDRTAITCRNNFKPVKQQLNSKKLDKLLQIIEKYPIGTDMKLSLYIAACTSNVNCLCPYPNVVNKVNSDSRSNEFTAINEEIPSVSLVSYFLKAKRNKVLRSEVYPLIFWLVASMGPRMVLLKRQEHRLVLRKVTTMDCDLEPSMIFKLMNSRLSRGEVMWQGVKAGMDTTFAFHNCQVEDAHTIIHYGLHKNLNRHGVHGPGVYLTDDLQGCLYSSLPGYTWGKSRIGSQVRIAFVVEFVNHPSVLCYSGAEEPFSPSHSGNGDSMKYYFIDNPQLTRIRYMLVYITKPSKLPSAPLQMSSNRSKFVTFLNISRIVIALAILGMGATASSRASFPTFKDYLQWNVQQVVNKFSLKSLF